MPENIWVVDDDQSIRWVLQRALEKAGMNISVFEVASDLLKALHVADKNKQLPDAIITDIRMPGMDGFDLIKEIHNDFSDLPLKGAKHLLTVEVKDHAGNTKTGFNN